MGAVQRVFIAKAGIRVAAKWYQIFTVEECLQSLKDINTLVTEEPHYLSEQFHVLNSENSRITAG